ncbi:hypothetical protein NQZ68_012026 [Dissostichus eleginoides]|nr:hypothetical protein NQZ68_012026 [Dissostichus eleginoides]
MAGLTCIVGDCARKRSSVSHLGGCGELVSHQISRGQGRNYLGPQLYAESVWMRSLARGTSLERASCLPQPLLMTKEWTGCNVYCD